MRLYNLWPSDDGGHVWHGMWKVRKEKVSMATKREALIPQGIWWWTLSFSLHTLWMDPTIKILVDNQGTFTPVESKILFHSLRYCLCWERIPLPDAGSHLVSMCAFKMHTCAHKRKKKKNHSNSAMHEVSWRTCFHPNFTPGASELLPGSYWLVRMSFPAQRIWANCWSFHFPGKKEKNTAGGAEM